MQGDIIETNNRGPMAKEMRALVVFRQLNRDTEGDPEPVCGENILVT